MLNYFVFNGKSSRDFGIYIEKSPDSVHAERRGELFSVAGRNGSEVREDSTFENYNQTYEVGWKKEFERDAYQVSSDIASWLLGSSGYCRLEDTYEPEYFRMARFANPMSVNTLLNRRYGKTKLIFDCQPERFLKSGEKPVSIGTDTFHHVFINPTGMTARPLFKIKGSGGYCSFSVNTSESELFPGNAFTVDMSVRPNVAIYIDCKTYNIYYEDGQNASGATTINMMGYYDLPVFEAWNDVMISQATLESSSATLDEFSVIPRWWSL